jgi:hypothetical protein
MRLMKPSVLSGACALALLVQAFGPDMARADNFKSKGTVFFTNIQAGTQQGGIVPYLGFGQSELIGPDIQTGSILNLTGLIPVDATTFIFYGEVGPHPLIKGHPSVHVISTEDGEIFCTWTAVFTLKIINAQGDAILSGDGDFTVIGGTGDYRHATGRFRTLFQTDPVPAGADKASAAFQQNGTIHSR